MYGTALALMLVGAIYFAVFRRGAGTTAAILALAAAAVGAVPLRQGLHPDYATRRAIAPIVAWADRVLLENKKAHEHHRVSGRCRRVELGRGCPGEGMTPSRARRTSPMLPGPRNRLARLLLAQHERRA